MCGGCCIRLFAFLLHFSQRLGAIIKQVNKGWLDFLECDGAIPLLDDLAVAVVEQDLWGADAEPLFEGAVATLFGADVDVGKLNFGTILFP